jgi:hypothetical protein
VIHPIILRRRVREFGQDTSLPASRGNGEGPPEAVVRSSRLGELRVTEATGVESKTIHRLSEVDPKSRGFTRNADNPLDCDLLVDDEASLVDVVLMQARRMTRRC